MFVLTVFTYSKVNRLPDLEHLNFIRLTFPGQVSLENAIYKLCPSVTVD